MTEVLTKTRLDAKLSLMYPNLSRAYLQKLCRRGDILVNNVAQKNSYLLKPGDHISVKGDIDEPAPLPKIDLQVIYEDKDCLVINKPTGILSHSKGSFNPEATVASFIMPRLKDLSGERAGIVHRLDRATSGVMICAKTASAQTWLQKQFSSRKVNKTYVAIVGGQPEPAAAIIDMPIERSPKKPQTFRVSRSGKPALSEYRTLQTINHYSLLEIKPQTGRTHQLRVHLRQIGHPIAGDIFYGGPSAPRLFLHARQLEITLPSRERRIFTAEVPKMFSEFINRG